jgi:hypothetical protein
MSRKKNRIKPSAEFKAALAQSRPQDFDGHIDFQQLSAGEKLDWLCQAATYVYEFKGRAGKPPPMSETPKS